MRNRDLLILLAVAIALVVSLLIVVSVLNHATPNFLPCGDDARDGYCPPGLWSDEPRWLRMYCEHVGYCAAPKR